MEYVLILDIGTGGLHVSLMDVEGIVVSSAYKELIYTSDETHQELTFSPDEEFEYTLQLIERVLRQSAIDCRAVRSIAVTSQRHGGVFLNGHQTPVHACPNIDNMAGEEALLIPKADGERIYELTGRWPTGLFHAVRLRWFKHQRPDLYARIHTFLMINDWFAFKLTGTMRSEWTNAAETLLFDVNTLAWSDELVRLFDLDAINLPEVVEPGTITGTLLPSLASRLGLSPEITVVLAAADTQSALVGTGSLQHGDVTVVNGSTTPIQMVVDRLLIDPRCRIWSGPYLPGKWVLESNCGKSGMIYRQYVKHLSDFLGVFLPEHRRSPDEIGAIADSYLEAATGVQPFLGPCIADVSHFLGMPNALFIAGEEVNPFMAIIPAFIENLAFGIVANIEQLETISGAEIKTIRMTGGGNRNALLTKILPLLLQDRTITKSASTESTSRGAAIQAFVANGAFPDLDHASAVLLQPQELVDSHSMQADRPRYQRKYEEWKKRHQQIVDYLQ